ncbi:MAG: glycine cleavage system protein R [Verrucomicrobia bacterium]|nr:glycine cleavage system protein R [Verrucomicrobiota bacterium]
MQVPLVMTVIGKDRPGLVESVASLVSQHGGNWLESRMCRLGGEFAGILRLHVVADQEQALFQALQGLQAHGLTVVVHPDRPEAAPAHRQLVQMEIVGQDRPGIVRQISSALARQNVNVEELATECHSAPMSGETLFTAQAKLLIPSNCNVAELRRELEKIAGDLLVDVTFQELAEP